MVTAVAHIKLSDYVLYPSHSTGGIICNKMGDAVPPIKPRYTSVARVFPQKKVRIGNRSWTQKRSKKIYCKDTLILRQIYKLIEDKEKIDKTKQD